MSFIEWRFPRDWWIDTATPEREGCVGAVACIIGIVDQDNIDILQTIFIYICVDVREKETRNDN